MRAIIVPLLRCPATGQRLRLFAERGGPSPRPNGVRLGAYLSSDMVQLVAQSNLGKRLGDSTDGGLAERLMGFDVHTGALYTSDREHVYPIVNGIPRLLPPDQCRHTEETDYYRKRLEAPSERCLERPKAILEDTLGSYTIQWEELDCADSAGRVPIQDRFEMVQDELGISDFPGVLAGKRHVDAACDNAAVALRIADLGVEVFALDPSASVERDGTHEHSLPRHGIVHFIQADLAAPPLAPGVFESLYCGGALHRSGDFETGLHKLAALLTPEGSRMYVWTRRRRLLADMIFAMLRALLGLVPTSLRRSASRVAAVPYAFARFVARMIFGRDAYPRLTFNQSLLQFMDALGESWGSVPSARAFEAMIARMSFSSQQLKRPGRRGYGILAIRNAAID